jgi:hypothetical protein
LGPLLFHAYVKDIWRNYEPTVKLFGDDYIIYRKIMNESDIETLQVDLDGLGSWAVENAMKINTGKCEALSFKRARVKDPQNYFLGGSKDFGREQLQIFRNNLTQRLKLG